MSFQDEAEMQRLVGELIAAGGFADAISGADHIHQLARPAPDVLPVFAIDRVARAAMIAAASSALESIHDLTLLTSDLNISMQKGETLRPDFVCIAGSGKAVYLIELKKSAQTAREAVSELLGYEHEIRNYLPFLSEHEFNFVLISAEWSTLLDHSAASACCWSGKKILCLEAGISEGVVSLKPRIPTSWTITGATAFPKGSLQTFEVTLDGPGADEDGDPDPRLHIAMELLARAGDRTGSHGFAMLWRDVLTGAGDHFRITMGGVDSIAFFNAALTLGTIRTDQGHFSGSLAKAIEGNTRAAPDALNKLVDQIRPLLEEIAPVAVSDSIDWHTVRKGYLCRAEPLTIEFWGMLGDHARSYLINPAVREHRTNLLGGGVFDWRYPFLGLFLLEGFSGSQFLRDGEVRLVDAFEMGRVLGIDGTLRPLLGENQPHRLRPVLETRFQWNARSTAYVLEEAQLFASSTSSIKAPDEPLNYSLHPSRQSDEEYENLVRWFTCGILRNQPQFVEVFNLGMRSGLALCPSFRAAAETDMIEQRNKIEPQINDLKAEALRFVDEAEAAGRLREDQAQLAREVRGFASIDEEQLRCILRLIDCFVPAVPHDLNEVAPSIHDWQWLKQGVREMREQGQRPAVALSADGTLGTMILQDPMLLMMGDVADPETEVLFLNNLSGLAMLHKTTWDALERGEHFPVM